MSIKYLYCIVFDIKKREPIGQTFHSWSYLERNFFFTDKQNLRRKRSMIRSAYAKYFNNVLSLKISFNCIKRDSNGK